MNQSDLNEYMTESHVQSYLARADKLPHRAEGEAIVLELLPVTVRRVLDLGAGDGRLLALVMSLTGTAARVALQVSVSDPIL